MIDKLFDDREDKLIERMEVRELGNKIYITEFGTVYTESINGKKEMIFDKFIKETLKKVSKEESSVKYDKETNQFYLIEDEPVKYFARKLAYPIDIKKEYMEDYVFGKYNKITSAMHDLYVKSMTNEERQKMQIDHENQKNEIIAKMNTEHELPTPAEARIYLDFLEEITRENNEEIKDNTKDIAKATLIPVGTGALVAGATSIVAADATLTGAVLIAGMISYSTLSLMETRRFAKGDTQDSLTIVSTVKYLKDKITKIKEKKHDNKMIETKAEKLLEIENVDKMIMAKSYSIEEFDNTVEDTNIRQALNLKDSIMKDLDRIIDRLEYINSEDRGKYLEKAKSIIDEYLERHNKIINQDSKTIDLEADNLTTLRIDMLKRIADLETEVTEIRNKDVQKKTITDEGRLLTEKIEGFTELDQDIQKVHENTMKKVKVKSLQKN